MKKGKGTTKSVVPAVVIGFFIIMCICAAATIVIPNMVFNGLIEIDAMGIYATALRVVALFIGTLVAGMLAQQNKSIVVYFCTAASFLFICTLGLLFNSIDPKSVLYGMLGGAIGSVLANIIVIRIIKPKQNKRSNRHSR